MTYKCPHDGVVYASMEEALIINMQTMNDWQKNKYLRFGIRLLNNDKKVWRLIKLRDEGFISHHQFLSEM